MLYWIKVRRLCWPWNIMSIEPNFGLFAVCLGSLSCWKMISELLFSKDLIPFCRPSSRILTNRSPSILLSILHASPFQAQDMYPHIITEPPQNFKAPSTSLSVSPSPGNLQAHFLISNPKLLILVSSENINLLQSTIVQYWYCNAKSSLLLLYLGERSGFFFTTAYKLAFFKALVIIQDVRCWLVISLNCLANWTIFTAFW